jgi:hypothetical protein
MSPAPLSAVGTFYDAFGSGVVRCCSSSLETLYGTMERYCLDSPQCMPSKSTGKSLYKFHALTGVFSLAETSMKSSRLLLSPAILDPTTTKVVLRDHTTTAQNQQATNIGREILILYPLHNVRSGFSSGSLSEALSTIYLLKTPDCPSMFCH